MCSQAKISMKKRDGGSRLTLELTPLPVKTIPLWTNMIEGVIQQVKAIFLDGKSIETKKAIQLVIDKNWTT